MDPAQPNKPPSHRGKNIGGKYDSQGPRRLFYGWYIVAAATLAGTIQAAVFNVGAQALVLPLIREFNVTRTAVSFAFSLRRLEGALTGPIEGYLIHWIGPRRYMVIGWVIFGLGFIATGLCQNIYQFYLAFLLVTLGQSVAGFLPIVAVLINWFDRWRGRTIAIYQLGNSFGAVLVPVLAWFILNAGWRQTMVVVGIAVIIIGIPLALVMRPHPESYGFLPDGADPTGIETDRVTTENSTAPDTGLSLDSEPTVSQALRSRNFWFLGLSHSAGITAWGALQVHQIPALVDIGINELTAASILSYTLIIAALGRLIGGFLGDVVGTKRVTAIAFIAQGIGIAVLALATTMTQVLIFATVFGIAFGTRGTLMTVLRAEVFGRRNFSRLAGWMDPISSVFVLISPIFAALIYDSVGSYKWAFLVLAVVNASGALLLIGVRVPNRRSTILLG